MLNCPCQAYILAPLEELGPAWHGRPPSTHAPTAPATAPAPTAAPVGGGRRGPVKTRMKLLCCCMRPPKEEVLRGK